MADVADAAYGFEPWDKVRRHAEENIKTNNLSHLHIYPFGLSDQDAILPFQIPKDDNLGAGKFLKKDAQGDVSLEVRTGDGFFAEKGIKPGVIKIDVEGFEADALVGLSKPVPALSFEFTIIQRDVARACIARCAALGYAAFNAALGESQAFDGAWRSADDIRGWLDALPHEANSGDIYARLA